MSLAFDCLAPDRRRLFAGSLLVMLQASRWGRRERWAECCIVLAPERREVVHRQSLAAEFQGAGLLDAAHEVLARRVGGGELLIYLLRDDEDGAGVAFVVLDLEREARAR